MMTGITPVTVLFRAKEIPGELNCEGYHHRYLLPRWGRAVVVQQWEIRAVGEQKRALRQLRRQARIRLLLAFRAFEAAP